MPPVDDTYVVTLTVSPSSASIVVDGQQVARGEYIARLERDGVAHTVQISAPLYLTRELTFVDAAPPESVQLLPDRAARKARRARREAREREAREREKAGDKAGQKDEKQAERAPAGDKGGDKAGQKVEKQAERAPAEPKAPPAPPAPPASPARKSDNINPWASSR